MHDTIGQTDFHEAPRDSHDIGEANTQSPTSTLGQNEAPVADAGILVSVDFITIMTQAPRVACLTLAILAKLPTRLNCFAELANDLLG